MKLNKLLTLLLSTMLVASARDDVYPCTLFNAAISNSILVGRNLDWKYNDGRVWVHPPEKEKFGMILFEQYGEDLPFEGMNSEGLFIGENAVPETETPFFCGKPLVRSLKLIVLVLERCASVEDALKLIPNYTVIFGTLLGYPRVHYMIADKSGDSAIVEYCDNKLRITRKRKDERYQLMTNFYIVNPDPVKVKANSKKDGYDRYAIAKKLLHNTTVINVPLCKTILEACYNDIFPTIWSNVYDLKKLEVHTCFNRNFKRSLTFSLQMEFKKGRHDYTLSSIFK